MSEGPNREAAAAAAARSPLPADRRADCAWLGRTNATDDRDSKCLDKAGSKQKNVAAGRLQRAPSIDRTNFTQYPTSFAYSNGGNTPARGSQTLAKVDRAVLAGSMPKCWCDRTQAIHFWFRQVRRGERSAHDRGLAPDCSFAPDCAVLVRAMPKTATPVPSLQRRCL